MNTTTVHERYLAETDAVLHRRLLLVLALFFGFVGASVVVECVTVPEWTTPIIVAYALEWLTAAAALHLLRLRRVAPRQLAAGLMAALLALLTGYNAFVGGAIERVIMAHLSLLGATAVVLPWGWRGQVTIAIGSLVTFVAATPFMPTTVPLAFPMIALANGLVTSVFGAYFLDRYRYDAFANAAAKEDEANVSSALLHVVETLTRHLDDDDVLERVNRLAVETLGCDWSSTFVWDPARAVFRLHSNVGSTPQVREALEKVEFPVDSLPLIGALRRGELAEITQPEGQTLVPLELMTRFEHSSSLTVPIYRGDDLVATLVNGYCTRTGPFSQVQRRLTLGIAHATAIALENVRLITDLRAASRLKSEFVSTMSHELRTPLNVILGFAEMARDLGDEPAERNTCLDRIESAGRDLLDLVEGTLEIGRIEAGRDTPCLQPVPFQSFWTELGESARGIPRRSGVALEWDADVPGVSLVTDPRKLSVVIRNLVVNALKFTERGRVRAEARAEADAIVVRVSDTGIGIAPQDQAFIFEMFRQADQSDSRRYGGVGLGLYIVRRFVTQLGCRLHLESTVGRGSTFTLHLPLDATA